MELVPIEVTWAVHRPYWFGHGTQGDPQEFFGKLGSVDRVCLLRAISDHAVVGDINKSRGNGYGWDDPPGEGELVLFKYKSSSGVARIFAIIHEFKGEKRAVMLHGFKGHQGKRREVDDPKFKTAKARAEKLAKQYLAWVECEGSIQ